MINDFKWSWLRWIAVELLLGYYLNLDDLNSDYLELLLKYNSSGLEMNYLQTTMIFKHRLNTTNTTLWNKTATNKQPKYYLNVKEKTKKLK